MARPSPVLRAAAVVPLLLGALAAGPALPAPHPAVAAPAASPMVMSPEAAGAVPPRSDDALCLSAPLRTGARGTTQVDHTIDGQSGVAQVPTTVPGASYGRPASADVYVIEPTTKEFFQGGWYVGGFPANSASNGLPATSTPRAFFGEWINSSLERLSSPVALNPGSQYTFSVRLGPDGRAYGFVNGVQRWISTQTHFAPYMPGVTGESNNTCTGMNSRWFAQAATIADTKTLQLHRFGGSYSYWVQHVTVDNSAGRFLDGRFGGVSATDCANPTGSCQYRT